MKHLLCVIKFDGTNWSEISGGIPPDFQADVQGVYSLAIDNSNNLWIGSGFGLAVYKEGGVTLAVPTIHDKAQEQVKIYPNPTSDFITILQEFQNSKVAIYNVSGSLISQQEMTSRNNVIDVQNLKNGMYFIKITNDRGKSISKKIIKQ